MESNIFEFRNYISNLHNEIEYYTYRALVSFSCYKIDKEDEYFNKLIHFGTGFLLTKFNNNKPYHFIITAKHVIDDAKEYFSTIDKKVFCLFPMQSHLKPTDSVQYAQILLSGLQERICSYEEHDIAFIDVTDIFNILLSKHKNLERFSLQTFQSLKAQDNDVGFILGLPATQNKYNNQLDLHRMKFNWRMLLTIKADNPTEQLKNHTTIKKPIFLEFNRKDIQNQQGDIAGNFVKTEGMSGSPFIIGNSVKGVLVEVYPDRSISPYPQALVVSDLQEVINEIDKYIVSINEQNY